MIGDTAKRVIVGMLRAAADAIEDRPTYASHAAVADLTGKLSQVVTKIATEASRREAMRRVFVTWLESGVAGCDAVPATAECDRGGWFISGPTRKEAVEMIAALKQGVR